MNIDETIKRQKKSKLKYGTNRLNTASGSKLFVTKTNGRSSHTQSTNITNNKSVSIKKAGSATVAKGRKTGNESYNATNISQPIAHQTSISKAQIAEPQIQKPPVYKEQRQQIKIAIELQSTASYNVSYSHKSYFANGDTIRWSGGGYEVMFIFTSTKLVLDSNNQLVPETETNMRWTSCSDTFMGASRTLLKTKDISQLLYSYIISVYDKSNNIITRKEFTRTEITDVEFMEDAYFFDDGVSSESYDIMEQKITQKTQGYVLDGVSLSQVTTSDLFTVGYVPLFKFLRKDIISETDSATGGTRFLRNDITSSVCAFNMRKKKIDILSDAQISALSRMNDVNLKRQSLLKNNTLALDRNFERYMNPNYNDVTGGLTKEYRPPARAVFLSFYRDTPNASEIIKPVMMNNQFWAGVANIGVSAQRINPTPKAKSFRKSVVYNKVLDDTTSSESSSASISYTEEQITTIRDGYVVSDPFTQTDVSNYTQEQQQRQFLSSHFLDNINPRPIKVSGDAPKNNRPTRGLYATNKRGHIKKSKVM